MKEPEAFLPLLRIADATVMRGGKRTLNNISLSIKEGENVAIVGPNGSGKSTLIQLITRQLYPLAGENQSPVVELFGQDRWDVFELRSMLGILSNDIQQDFAADDTLDGIDTVLSGFFASRGVSTHQVVTAEMRLRAEEVMDLVGAGSLSARKMCELSTGEARRLLIARTLVSNPRALVLDEPTAGLDLAARRRFLTDIRQIAASQTAVILVTHHVEEIIPEIKRVVLIKNGTIFRDGPKMEILTSETLTELFDEPIVLRSQNEYYSAEIETLSGEVSFAFGQRRD